MCAYFIFQVEYLLREWVRLYHQPAAGKESEKAFSSFVAMVRDAMTTSRNVSPPQTTALTTSKGKASFALYYLYWFLFSLLYSFLSFILFFSYDPASSTWYTKNWWSYNKVLPYQYRTMCWSDLQSSHWSCKFAQGGKKIHRMFISIRYDVFSKVFPE